MRINEVVQSNDLFSELGKKCSDIIKYYQKSKNRIFRGLNTASSEWFYSPKPSNERISVQISNHYTLIMNNNKIWAQYPKRNIICSTDHRYARSYGKLFLILPINNTKIGVVPGGDIWALYWDRMNALFKYYGIKDDNYSEMIKQMSKINRNPKEYYSYLQYQHSNNIANFLTRNNDSNLLKFALNVINPMFKNSRGTFKVYSTKNLKLTPDTEVWFNDAAYYIEMFSATSKAFQQQYEIESLTSSIEDIVRDTLENDWNDDEIR